MAKKFYVVWQGRETGIFTDWATCKRQVDKFAGARYKSFPTREEAEEAEAAFHGRGRAPSGKAGSPKRAPARKRSSVQTVKTYSADEVAAIDSEVKIFTDGGCEPNPG